MALFNQERFSAHSPSGRRPSGRRHARLGVTLIDLTVAVMIMAVLAAVAFPRFAATLGKIRLESAAKRLVADLGYARQQAISTSQNQQVTFQFGSTTYQLDGVEDLNHGAGVYTVDLSAGPYQVLRMTPSFNGDSSVVFDIYGQPDNAGSIVIDGGAAQVTVAVDGDTGKAHIQ